MQNPGVNPPESQVAFTACIPCSGVYIARWLKSTVPGTAAEVKALAVQMGTPLGVGANYAHLQTGIFQRYGLASLHYEGAAAAIAQVRARVSAGIPFAVALAGDQYNLNPRYQSNHVTHSIVVLYKGDGSDGIQLDPLAPAGYMGDPFGDAELVKFATACLIVMGPKPVTPPPPPPAPKLYTQADLDAAVAAAKAGLFTQAQVDAARAAGIKAAADAAAATK